MEPRAGVPSLNSNVQHNCEGMIYKLQDPKQENKLILHSHKLVPAHKSEHTSYIQQITMS
jgi:hypothetical protein